MIIETLIASTIKRPEPGRVSELRVVLGHLQARALATTPEILKSYSDNLKELRKRNVYAKVSIVGLAQKNPGGDVSLHGGKHWKDTV